MAQETNHKNNTNKLVRISILTAILLFLNFTSFGYVKVGVLEITLMHLPVIIGAILMGSRVGAFLGLVFGLTSFAQCFMGSPLGTVLVQLSPLNTFIVCVIPRVLMGFLVGIIFNALHKTTFFKKLSYVIASFLGAVINTFLFMGMLFLLFGNNTGFLSFLGIETVTLTFIASLIGINGILEAAICIPFGLAVERIIHAINKNGTKNNTLDA